MGNDVTAAGCKEADAGADAESSAPGPADLSLCSRASPSLVSALGPARCDPDMWQDCWLEQTVPQGLFVQLNVMRLSHTQCNKAAAHFEDLAWGGCSLTGEWVGSFFCEYGEVHIEAGDGGTQFFVTLTQAHLAIAAQQP